VPVFQNKKEKSKNYGLEGNKVIFCMEIHGIPSRFFPAAYRKISE